MSSPGWLQQQHLVSYCSPASAPHWGLTPQQVLGCLQPPSCCQTGCSLGLAPPLGALSPTETLLRCPQPQDSASSVPGSHPGMLPAATKCSLRCEGPLQNPPPAWLSRAVLPPGFGAGKRTATFPPKLERRGPRRHQRRAGGVPVCACSLAPLNTPSPPLLQSQLCSALAGSKLLLDESVPEQLLLRD